MIRAPLLALGISVALSGCAPAAPPAPPAALAAPSIEPLLEQAREALRGAGIDEVRWGLVPYIDAGELDEPYRTILDHVEARLGVPQTLVVGADYVDVRRRAVDGSIDVAVLPPYTYVSARSIDDGLTAFATHVAEGSPTYGAYIVVRDDSGIRELEDLRGRNFGFVDPLSTSGWLFPAERLLEAGVHPLRDLDPVFVGAHDDVIDAVIAGDLVAGACYSGAIGAARLRNPGANRLRILAKSRRIPYEAYAARAGFPDVAARAIARLLAEISSRTPQGRERLASTLRINGFLPVTDHHYDVVRDVARRVGAAVSAEDLAMAAQSRLTTRGDQATPASDAASPNADQ